MEKRILRAGLVGLGGMGRGHLNNYNKLSAEGDLVKIVAVCDIDPEKFKGAKIDFNLEEGKGNADIAGLNCYIDMDEMIKKEELDMVTLALPTYLHCEATVKFLNAGVNVLCEKPMAMTVEECDLMIETAKKNNKLLMIGQCLRFWDEYVMLKKYIEDGTFGKATAGYFYRGGGTPKWSYKNWYLRKELGGGAIFDQHVHDVDTVNFLFGLPQAVSSIGKILIEGSNFDTVSTNYIYEDGPVVNSQNDWTMSGLGFIMGFRVNFSDGTVVMDKGFTAAKKDEKQQPVEFAKTNAYYNETKYFAECILGLRKNDINTPEESRKTIKLVLAEIESAGKNGEIVKL